MTSKEKWLIVGAVFAVPLVMILAFNALVVQPSSGGTGTEASLLGTTRINSPVEMNNTLYVKDAATFASTQSTTGASTFTGAATFNGAATLNGAVTANSTMAVVGNLTLSGFAIHSSATMTPTDGGTITPTAEFVTLVPGGALGADLGACTTGSSTVLYNSVNASVVITDTGNGTLAGNQTLGQYDALGLVCIGAKWIQVSAVSAN